MNVLLNLHNFSHDSDDSSSDADVPSNTKERQLDESIKSKKKHKKHKKHKSRRGDDGDGGKERSSRSSKKHKKHKKKQKHRDASNSNSDTDENSKKSKYSENTNSIAATVAIAEAETSTKSSIVIAASTLNKKFTEIMKSNGRVVVATVPTTKILPSNNGNGNLISTKPSKKIPTDPNRLVELITQSLDAKIPSMEIVSSESESDVPQDLDSPDVAVIEDDELNLDELMKQKELLQARLGAYDASDTEVEEVTMAINATMKSIDKERDAQSSSNIKRPPVTDTDIILLDDSSGEALKQKKRRKTSPARERIARDNRQDRERERERERTGAASNAAASATDRHASPDRASKARRPDNENRYKEDLRKEIDREKERIVRDNQRRRGDRDTGVRGDRRERSRFSMEREQRRSIRSRSRGGSRDRDRRFDRDRDNWDRNRFMRDRSRNDREDRYRYSGNGGGGDYRKRREEKNDKFVGSLSEGQKIERDSSSDSEVANLDIADDDDEEKIIEQRRKKREELLKVSFHSRTGF